MKERIIIISLLFSSLLFVYFVLTDNGIVLVPILIGLLVAFICAMILVANK